MQGQQMRVRGAVVAAVLLVGGCGAAEETAEADGNGGEGERTVCFAFQDVETEFWAAGIQSITESIEEQGWSVTEQNSRNDANLQSEQIANCISQDVDGIIIIPQDGETVVEMIAQANAADIPIGVFNRPPADSNPNANIQVVADNAAISEETVAFLAEQARASGDTVHPLIMVGDLSDPNAVDRKAGFDAVMEEFADEFEPAVEVSTEWDAETGRAGLESALQANPDVNLIFTSSDFLYPQIRSVLEPLGKWEPSGEDGHVFLGGVDGDAAACDLMREGYVDATGVQNLFFEADAIVEAVSAAIEEDQGAADEDIEDTGFVITQDNFEEMESETWGCVIEPPAVDG